MKRRKDWLQIRISESLKQYLREKSDLDDISITQYVINLIVRDKHENEKK